MSFPLRNQGRLDSKCWRRGLGHSLLRWELKWDTLGTRDFPFGGYLSVLGEPISVQLGPGFNPKTIWFLSSNPLLSPPHSLWRSSQKEWLGGSKGAPDQRPDQSRQSTRAFARVAGQAEKQFRGRSPFAGDTIQMVLPEHKGVCARDRTIGGQPWLGTSRLPLLGIIWTWGTRATSVPF